MSSTRMAQHQIDSRKGKEKLVHQGYLFRFDKLIANGEQKAWRCERSEVGCKARAWTGLDNNVLLDLPKNQRIVHSHDANPADLIKKEQITTLKRRAQYTTEPPALIRANVLENVPSPALDIFPTMDATKKLIKRVRMRVQAPPPNRLQTGTDLQRTERWKSDDNSTGNEQQQQQQLLEDEMSRLSGDNLLFARLVHAQRDCLFSSAPQVTPECKKARWQMICDQLVAHGAMQFVGKSDTYLRMKWADMKRRTNVKLNRLRAGAAGVKLNETDHLILGSGATRRAATAQGNTRRSAAAARGMAGSSNSALIHHQQLVAHQAATANLTAKSEAVDTESAQDPRESVERVDAAFLHQQETPNEQLYAMAHLEQGESTSASLGLAVPFSEHHQNEMGALSSFAEQLEAAAMDRKSSPSQNSEQQHAMSTRAKQGRKRPFPGAASGVPFFADSLVHNGVMLAGGTMAPLAVQKAMHNGASKEKAAEAVNGEQQQMGGGLDERVKRAKLDFYRSQIELNEALKVESTVRKRLLEMQIRQMERAASE